MEATKTVSEYAKCVRQEELEKLKSRKSREQKLIWFSSQMLKVKALVVKTR